MIDDVELWEGRPYDDTFPPYLGDDLQSNNIPYRVDSLGGAYRVREITSGDEKIAYEEIIVQFEEIATEVQKASIRTKYGAILIDSCMCNKLEMWQLGDFLLVGGNVLSPDGLSIGVEERVGSATAEPIIKESGPNHIIHSDSILPYVNVPQAFPESIPYGKPDPDLKIAVLDTGIDYFHNELKDNWFKNMGDIVVDGLDQDSTCYPDDFAGWNFVNNHNNAGDDNGHGTHVTGIITQNLLQDSCDYAILPLKVMDSHGVGDVFKSTCAMYYAIAEEAKIINCSWGYYGTSNGILYNAIDTAEQADILVVASVGNDTVDLDTIMHFPSSFDLPNILAVGAHDSDYALADFSNFSTTEVDIVAPGVAVQSYSHTSPVLIPKTGTSMAAPAVTASAGLAYCSGETGYQAMKARIKLCANNSTALDSTVDMGHYNSNNEPCLVTLVNEEESLGEITIFPNPTHDMLWLEYEGATLNELFINVYNLMGQIVFRQEESMFQNGALVKIPVSKLPSGMYILSLQGENVLKSVKFIVKHK